MGQEPHTHTEGSRSELSGLQAGARRLGYTIEDRSVRACKGIRYKCGGERNVNLVFTR